MTARAELFAPLGLKPAEVRHGGHMAGTCIEADPTGATAVPGVWVAGNLATWAPSSPRGRLEPCAGSRPWLLARWGM
jgi:hypothetical protein